MSGWNPQQYLTFESQRLRPAVDLLSRVPLEAPADIVDLGCGTGNITRIIHERWPHARVIGVDSSEAMLAKARQVDTAIEWQEHDIGHWRPQERFDLIYSNAALHWLPDHEALFPHLMGYLKPSGHLAVQMPANFTAPTHTLVYEVARSGPWRDTLEPLVRSTPVMESTDYYWVLTPHSEQLDIWETTYLQALEGDNPVAEWIKGSWLKPFLDALGEPEKDRFEAEYRRRILEAYPKGANAKTLLPFRRIFIVAKAS